MTSVLCEIVTMTYENGLSLVNVHTVKTRTEFPKHPHPHRLQPTIRGLPSVQRHRSGATPKRYSHDVLNLRVGDLTNMRKPDTCYFLSTKVPFVPTFTDFTPEKSSTDSSTAHTVGTEAFPPGS